ncbi:recombinase [Mycolicibacterium sp.]|uniref:recombinase n=1 Tax=Mycolicibacterium sp. TaxID=2320850 RepID=UPI00355E46EA
MTPGADSRSCAVWQLFSDWCTALGHRALPAESAVLAQFLAANPAAQGTQRRRVGVVNAMHRRSGHPEPGRAETVRELLDSRRTGRRRARAAAVIDAIGRLPETGWPAVLFSSRDALMLVLWAAGMPYTGITALRLGDIRGDRQHLTAGSGGEVFTTPAELVCPDLSPIVLWRNWHQIRSIQHRQPSPRRVAAFLASDRSCGVEPAPESLPVFTPIDRWGDIAAQPDALSAEAVADIVSGHLRRTAPRHSAKPLPRRPLELEMPEPVEYPEPDPLDPDSVDRGIAARRRAATDLASVDDLLEDVSARADRLLADLLQLLDEEAASG